MSKKFKIIAAVSSGMGIGYKNQLPWKRFSADMEWFRRQTTNHTVIMGRRTWESMNMKNLPNRANIVVTSNPGKYNSTQMGTNVIDSIMFVNSLNDALAWVKTEKAFIIGGRRLYQEGMEHDDCESLLITHLDAKFDVDVYFPEINQDKFKIKQIIQTRQLTEIKKHDGSNEINNIPYEIVEYQPIFKQIKEKTQKSEKSEKSQNQDEEEYLNGLRRILDHGEIRQDRTNVGTKALFGQTFRYDLRNGFPLLTTKKMFIKGVIHELLWFLSGETDVNILKKKGVRIWDGNTNREFLDKNGLKHRSEWDMGPSYSFQFRYAGASPYHDNDYFNNEDLDGIKRTRKRQRREYFEKNGGVDQISYVVNELKNNPHSRRAIINLWNVKDLPEMSLPPCLFMYQFWVSEEKYLNCVLYQRSGDMGLGVPFNIASASLLTHIIGKLTGLEPKELIHNIGDAHVYLNHIEPLKKQIVRTPRPFPILQIVDRQQSSVDDFTFDDFIIHGYHPYPGIKMDMAQ